MMSVRRSAMWSLLIGFAVSAGGCSSSDDAAPTADDAASPDVGSDAGAKADQTSADSATDDARLPDSALSDAPSGDVAVSDVARDSAIDSSIDSPSDVSADAPRDTGPIGDAADARVVDAPADAVDANDAPVDGGALVLACIASGGTVVTRLCCQATGNFASSCTTGACGCPPGSSHNVEACDCGSKCWNGQACVGDL